MLQKSKHVIASKLKRRMAIEQNNFFFGGGCRLEKMKGRCVCVCVDDFGERGWESK